MDSGSRARPLRRRSALSRFLNPDLGPYLQRDQDEVARAEVVQHPITLVLPVLEVVVALGLLLVVGFGPLTYSIVPLTICAALIVNAGWEIAVVRRDRFVVTNLRVLRFTGVFARRRAAVPINRIVDITVDQSLWGRLLNYGHFTFESAAQVQGLRVIKFVGDPLETEKKILEHVLTSAPPVVVSE